MRRMDQHTIGPIEQLDGQRHRRQRALTVDAHLSHMRVIIGDVGLARPAGQQRLDLEGF